jgi:EAL domain-containing protein (putative c-di-GMP-specific phosphodiesterase class I)
MSVATPKSGLAVALERRIRSLYQPIVELASGRTVSYEALARGPEGSALESPLALFAAARDEDRLAELDCACRAAAVTGALNAGLRPPAALFVNAEPEALSRAAGVPAELLEAIGDGLRIFVEITERALTERPAELLEAVDRLRAAGLGTALDDVGTDERSLALLPLLRPDVVKLDISLIPPVAEPATSLRVPLRQAPTSPVALVHRHRSLRTGRKDVLLSASRALEAKALELGPHAVVAAAFQNARHFTPATLGRYGRLGARSALVAALGGRDGSPAGPRRARRRPGAG